MKIGVFDSGVGGITVLSELRRSLGPVDYVYLGDTAHVPYGTKSPAQIEKLSLDCARTLKSKSIDALVVACNTASSWAFEVIETLMHPIPVFGVVGPGVESALASLLTLQGQKQDPPILVLATRATVASHAYGKALNKILQPGWAPEQESARVIEQACPLLVPMIEEGWIDHSILHLTIAEYVKPHLSRFKTGVALLGCTHYPWIHAAFEKAMPGWTVVNSARAVTESLQKSAFFQKWEGFPEAVVSASAAKATGSVEWIFTDPEAVPAFAKKYMQI